MTMSSDKVQSSSNNTKINNPMIYSGDPKYLSALLSTNSNPVIKELLNKHNLRDQSGLGKDNYNEQQRLDDIIIKQGMDILAQQA